MKLKIVKNLKKPKIQRLLQLVFPIGTFFSFVSKCVKNTTHSKSYLVQTKKKKGFIGLVMLSSFLFLGIRFLYLNVLSIDPKKQHQGYGKKVLGAIEKSGRKKRIDYFFLVSGKHRKKAREFYLKNGFKKLLGVFFWKKL